MKETEGVDDAFVSTNNAVFSSLGDSYCCNVLLLATAMATILVVIVVTVTSIGKNVRDAEYFRDVVNNSAELPLLRPIVVSIFERAVYIAPKGDEEEEEEDDGEEGDGRLNGNSDENFSDEDRYNERLVVVRPNNWLIYTNNGLTFNYVTSNVSGSRLNCSASGSLTAVEYRLKKIEELYDVPFGEEPPTRSLRFSCINYTFDQLTRVFTHSSNRTDIDMTEYFDKKSRPNAPDFTVASVLQFLVTNQYV